MANETRAKFVAAIMNAFESREAGEEARRNIMRQFPSGSFDDDCRDCSHRESEIAALRRQVQGFESLRPLWAQGYSSDSMAAQATGSALASLWQMLGVDNQTDAAQKLKGLLS